MIELSPTGWAVALACGFLVGLSKNGLPGVATPAIVALACVMPAKASVGFLLPVLIMGDICALAYYRRHAVWSIVLRLLPWAVAGIVAGYFLLGGISDEFLKRLIGAIVVALLVLDYWRSVSPASEALPARWWFAAAVGILAGITTVLANAAGPLLIIYFVAMRVNKDQFMGTSAWYFFMLNCLKVPFFMARGMITAQSFLADLVLIPAVLAGAVAGVLLLKRIPQKGFTAFAKIVALIGAIGLLLP